jgi:FkbM family methyltransferase
MAIDIGANIGHMSVQMALVTGPTGLTLAFDPNPFVFEILSENANLNPTLYRLEAHNLAISDQERTYYYHSSEASFNNGGISPERKSRHGRFVLDQPIRGIPLESFLHQHYPGFLSRWKLVKIDTEGYDKEIIKSIAGPLQQYKPVVITECFGKNSPEEKFEQFHVLDQLGYELFYFSGFDVNAQIRPIRKAEDMLSWDHFDLYAQPKM